jgi:hypothetical protein
MDKKHLAALLAEIDLIQDPRILEQLTDALVERVNSMNKVHSHVTDFSWKQDSQMRVPEITIVDMTVRVLFGGRRFRGYVRVDLDNRDVEPTPDTKNGWWTKL